jgi:hypothetical protein
MRHRGKRRRLCAQPGVCFIFCCLILAGGAVEVSAAAAAGSSTSTATAPQQLVHAYPLGPKRLCCDSGSRPAAGSARRQARSAGQPAGRTGRAGSSFVILLGALGALLVLTVLSAVYRTRRRSAAPAPADGIEWVNESRHAPVDDVAGPPTRVALRATIPEPPATDRIERVKALQSQLSWLGFEPGQVDGRYGPLTTGAVRRFQEARGLPVDGVVDSLTADALRASTRQRPTTDRIERVKALQRQLTALGFEPGPVDGRYGPDTTEAVKRFQQGYDLRVDGVVDPLTRRALEHHALY